MFWVHAMAASRHLFTAKAASVFLKVTRRLGEARAPSTVAQWPPELRVSLPRRSTCGRTAGNLSGYQVEKNVLVRPLSPSVN